MTLYCEQRFQVYTWNTCTGRTSKVNWSRSIWHIETHITPAPPRWHFHLISSPRLCQFCFSYISFFICVQPLKFSSLSFPIFSFSFLILPNTFPSLLAACLLSLPFLKNAPGPSEFQRAPQTNHCLGNVVCCLHSPRTPRPPPPPVWQETMLGGVPAPGSSRPLCLKTLTCLTSGPGSGQLIRINLAVTSGQVVLDICIRLLLKSSKWCTPGSNQYEKNFINV